MCVFNAALSGPSVEPVFYLLLLRDWSRRLACLLIHCWINGHVFLLVLRQPLCLGSLTPPGSLRQREKERGRETGIYALQEEHIFFLAVSCSPPLQQKQQDVPSAA